MKQTEFIHNEIHKKYLKKYGKERKHTIIKLLRAYRKNMNREIGKGRFVSVRKKTGEVWGSFSLYKVLATNVTKTKMKRLYVSHFCPGWLYGIQFKAKDLSKKVKWTFRMNTLIRDGLSKSLEVVE